MKDRWRAEKMLPFMPGWTVDEIVGVLDGSTSAAEIARLAMSKIDRR
jgi:hypothetical protein